MDVSEERGIFSVFNERRVQNIANAAVLIVGLFTLGLGLWANEARGGAFPKEAKINNEILGYFLFIGLTASDTTINKYRPIIIIGAILFKLKPLNTSRPIRQINLDMWTEIVKSASGFGEFF